MFSQVDDLSTAFFTAIVACPACHEALDTDGGYLICGKCTRSYPEIGGIWRFLLSDQEQQYAPFLGVYRRIRQGGGWERRDDAYYLRRPTVAAGDPHEQIWRLRRRTFGLLMQAVQNLEMSNREMWALDLGAGNCWLSHHLSLQRWSGWLTHFAKGTATLPAKTNL